MPCAALRSALVACLLSAGALYTIAENSGNVPKPGEPISPTARKTWESALEWERHHAYGPAISSYRKANQQDEGRCGECLRRAYALAIEIGATRDAEAIARDMLAAAATPAEKAEAHFRVALAEQHEGIKTKRDREKCIAASCDEFKAALEAKPDMTAAHFSLGVSLAYLHQDDEARREFTSYVDQDKSASLMHLRGARFLGNVELARAAMAPPFSVTALDGRRVSLDNLAGKVVLIDFWATWCGPCREALPSLRRLSQKFAGQPLVVISISLDKDEAKWKDFVAKNSMTWLQYRDGGWDGPVAKQFGVAAIPATFTIDADGVLEDQHVGDADIERKLKKLVAQAAELANRKAAEAASAAPAATN